MGGGRRGGSRLHKDFLFKIIFPLITSRAFETESETRTPRLVIPIANHTPAEWCLWSVCASAKITKHRFGGGGLGVVYV